MPSSRGSSRPRDRTPVSYISRRVLYCWATREAPERIYSLNTGFPGTVSCLRSGRGSVDLLFQGQLKNAPFTEGPSSWPCGGCSPQLLLLRGVQACGRLIQKQDGRVSQEAQHKTQLQGRDTGCSCHRPPPAEEARGTHTPFWRPLLITSAQERSAVRAAWRRPPAWWETGSDGEIRRGCGEKEDQTQGWRPWVPSSAPSLSELTINATLQSNSPPI